MIQHNNPPSPDNNGNWITVIKQLITAYERCCTSEITYHSCCKAGVAPRKNEWGCMACLPKPLPTCDFSYPIYDLTKNSIPNSWPLRSCHTLNLGGLLWVVLIDQFRYIKVQPKTIDLSARLWGITTRFVGFIPQSLLLRYIVFRLNFNISKLVY